MTDDQRLASPGRHHRDPQGLVRSSLPFQILERTNVMHLNTVSAAAQFARLREESLHDLRRVGEPKRSKTIVKRGVDTPCERNSTPLSHQRGLALACDPDFQSGSPFAVFTQNLCAIAPAHRWHADTQLGCQRARERVMHDSLKTSHVAKVVRHPVEVHDAPTDALILGHDVEDRLVNQFAAMRRTTVFHLWLTFRLQDVSGHS